MKECEWMYVVFIIFKIENNENNFKIKTFLTFLKNILVEFIKRPTFIIFIIENFENKIANKLFLMYFYLFNYFRRVTFSLLKIMKIMKATLEIKILLTF